eukprot:TRINITY_DN173_c0_g1_i1.p1 TRINITY_DN173_c0_g1~~TRINITY_DN173_c0_g1_i1.p1  ORF type:complete len:222 (-),score=38.62 TRINITY_DN173_c0_g1_i1:67-732(-)
MIKALAVIAAIYVVATIAQTPSPCCTPDQWEAYDFAWDPERDFRAGLNISYDATNQQIAVGLSESHGPERQRTYDIISLWSKKLTYIVDYHSKQCYTTELTEPFVKQCIPDDAKFVNAATIGGTLNVDIFAFQDNQTFVFSTVTSGTCIPVSTTTIRADNGRGEPDVATQNIWDVTAGIKNTSVFVPPANCAQATPLGVELSLGSLLSGSVSGVFELFNKF